VEAAFAGAVVARIFFFLLPLLLNSKTVLANNKNPTYPADTPHVYDDKVRGGLVFFTLD
jgi:hypothetical protein